MKCPNCSSYMKLDDKTAHHGKNAFVMCLDDSCVYGQNWQRVSEIDEIEGARNAQISEV